MMVGAGALAVALAGCGGGTPFPQATNPAGTGTQARLLAAVQRTTDARTARITMTATTSGFPASPGCSSCSADATLTADGVVDLHDQRAAMTMHVTAAGQQMDFEMRVLSGVLYLKRGDTWTQTPTEPGMTSTPDPNNFFSYLQGVAPDVHVTGQDRLRGVDTTIYSGTLDLSCALERMQTNAQQRSALQRAQAYLGDLRIPFRAWVDGAGGLRKVAMTMDMTSVLHKVASGSKLHPTITVTMELYDFGVPVNVTAPSGAIDEASAAADSAAQADLRNGLAAEETYYTDSEAYTASPAVLRQIEPSLGWGTTLHVVVGDVAPGDQSVMCLWETSKSGTTFALGKVVTVGDARVFYGEKRCPDPANAANVGALGSAWPGMTVGKGTSW